eukprot:s163_g22.t1
MDAGLEDGLAEAVPLPAGLEKGCQVFKTMLCWANSFGSIGRCIVWILANFNRLAVEREVSALLHRMVLGKPAGVEAMHRGRESGCVRPLLPLPLGDLKEVMAAARAVSLDYFCNPHFAGVADEDVWVALALMALNGAAGKGRAVLERKPTASQAGAINAVRASIKRVLRADVTRDRSAEAAEKELASRYLSYTGEEVPKMQVLRIQQAAAALPPKDHGGSIDAREFVSVGTQWFLEHPEESLREKPIPGVKLQARVHVLKEESLEFFNLLVSRRICDWIADEDVLKINSEQVLSGMFAVGKGTYLSTGEEIQRIIMNLIPANAAFHHAQGGTAELPSICQYLSLVLHKDERFAFYQSDMTSAFYLFRIPSCWKKAMAFNISFSGEQIGLTPGVLYRPACAVIPMGWASAVSVMQEIAERLASIAKLPAGHKVRRTAPIPPWLVDTVDAAAAQGRPWFHVYLDNFCAMEKQGAGDTGGQGAQAHQSLEDTWTRHGVISSAKKRVSGEAVAQELGAHFDGMEGTMGPSPERLLKLLQATFVVLSKRRLKKKWVQVIAGRWVHCMSFRRPFMSFLDVTWAYIGGQCRGELVEAKVRSELLNCCCGCLLCHTNLRAKVSEVTTASDASSTGGAVGKSVELSPSGMQFAAADRAGLAEGLRVPLMVLSLFNGVGCAFRCYDLCGIHPMVSLAYETSKEANRVTSRRWPNVIINGDVRSIDAEEVRSWKYKYPAIEEIHVWAGFPCTDLSSAKYGRLNLEGAESGLFYELVRILKLIRKIYGYSFKIMFAAENVASMDPEAEREITATLGVKPWRLDPAGVVPIHRPRFCWTNESLEPMEGVTVEERPRWLDIQIEHEYPELSQWLEDGAEWPGYWQNAILPTCMKCIRRVRPPPKPAGIDRVSDDGKLRWMADEYRFPPYQYGDNFIIWVGNRWRYYAAVSRMAPILRTVESEAGLDEAIASWIQDEFEDGTPLHMVGDALSGLHHFEPFTRKKLHKSWRLYGIWRRYEVPCRAPPLTQELVLAMAGWCILSDELVMGSLLLLGFHCLLRTGEILQLRPCDFLVQGTQGLVSLPSSKSGVRNNSKESVSIHDPSTLETLKAMTSLKDWCAAGNVEYDPATDRGVGMHFWDQLNNGSVGKDRFKLSLAGTRLFEALHSVAGGTGSGLGSFVLSAVRDAFPSAVLSSVSVWPFQGGEVSVQCYNAALTLSSIYEHTDLSVICENERYLELCRVLLGQERPSLDSLNSAMSGNLVRVMMPCGSVHKLYGPGCPLLQLAGHLAAHPLYRLTTVRALPQIRKGAEAFTSDGWTALQRRMLQLCDTGTMVDRPSASPEATPAHCRTVSASTFLWGDGATDASLEPLRRMPLWQHSVDGMQVHADGHHVGGLDRSLGIVSNCQAVLPALCSTTSRATSMLRASAYLHQYERYGLSRDEMSEAILVMLQAQHDYEQLSASPG